MGWVASVLGLRPGLCRRMGEELRPLLAAVFPSAKLLPGLPSGQWPLFAVGDTVTRGLLARGERPLVVVYDCAEKRAKTECPTLPSGYEVLEAVNPRSCVSWEAVEALEEAAVKASRGARVGVRVVGEEDLLVLPLLLLVPQGSLVVYGQPGRGVVAVPATRWAKTLALHVLKHFSLEEY